VILKNRKSHVTLGLISKRPLSLWRTNGILGMYLWANFCHDFFETFFEDRKLISSMGYYYFSIGVQEQKLCPYKFKIGESGQQKQNSKFEYYI